MYYFEELKEWNFSKDKVNFEKVVIPHDWAINGGFDRKIDHQVEEVILNEKKVPYEIFCRTGGLPQIGKGFYNLDLNIKKDDNKKYLLYFEGAMSNAQVLVNGKNAGSCNYGYSSFYIDATEFIIDGKNLIEVELENLPLASRWYTGAGLYRRVFLKESAKAHFSNWGVYAQYLGDNKGSINLSLNNEFAEDKELTLELNIDGVLSLSKKITLPKGMTNLVEMVKFENLKLWSLENPQVYKLTASLKDGNNEILDQETVPFGARTIEFKYPDGFLLNGKVTKFNGVCMHHDLGPIGAEFNRETAKRQLTILKEMGCNAIRTAHNPAAPEYLDLCDEMGFLVMGEAFDSWETGKLKNDYSKFFAKDAEKDLTTMLLRDRNHPSVILWSIGNEVYDQQNSNGGKIAKRLVDIVKKYDTTRPTTAGLDHPFKAIESGIVDEIDIPAWNYKPFWYAQLHKLLPNKLMLGSETLSAVNSRGAFYLPATARKFKSNDINHNSHNLQCSGYAVDYVDWSTPFEVEQIAQEDCEYMTGQFIWTGFDYLGEPVPYNHDCDARSSYFGCVDLVGLPKSLYYLVQSYWRTDIDTLHIVGHWNWEAGQKVPVHIFSNSEEVELFLNGKSLGKVKKEPRASDLVYRYRFVYDEVTFEAGELVAVGYNDGKEVIRQSLKTADEVANIEFKADKLELNNDGKDMLFIEVSLVDKNGNYVPNRNDLIKLEIEGDGATIAAFDGGDPTSFESFNSLQTKLYNGKAVIYVRSEKVNSAGQVKITAISSSLSSTITINNK